MSDDGALTQMLARWEAGEHDALVELMPAVYDELRRVAAHHMAGERAGHTLAPTALVNEVYLRLGSYQNISWQNRAHFFAMASRIMHRVLVDHARKRKAAKRGGAESAVTLFESRQADGRIEEVDLIALDEALTQLEALDPRQCQVVQMRYFGGLKNDEIAAVLGVSVPTVKRDWAVARVWLRRALLGRN
jgi:RNA polymerase sigma factor (TIGR02999 family)